MIIYHGSDVVVKKPEILLSNRLLDFGIGFYTTSNREQAIRWAEMVSLRNNTGKKFLTIYNFDIEKAKSELKIIQFASADEKWLDFITANRRGKEIAEEYDIVIGPVADDSVYLINMKHWEGKTMDKSKFDAVLPIICSALAEKIHEELNLTEKEAVSELYSSHLYEMLEREETKVWHYSTEKLYELFVEEKNKGKITFPQV